MREIIAFMCLRLRCLCCSVGSKSVVSFFFVNVVQRDGVSRGLLYLSLMVVVLFPWDYVLFFATSAVSRNSILVVVDGVMD